MVTAPAIPTRRRLILQDLMISKDRLLATIPAIAVAIRTREACSRSQKVVGEGVARKYSRGDHWSAPEVHLAEQKEMMPERSRPW